MNETITQKDIQESLEDLGKVPTHHFTAEDVKEFMDKVENFVRFGINDFPEFEVYQGGKFSEIKIDTERLKPKVGIDCMYESPVKVIMPDIMSGFMTKLEGDIVKTVMSYGITVDKDELIKALQYDRNQYNKGYADGVRAVMESLKEHSVYAKMPFSDASRVWDRHTDVVTVEQIDRIVKEMVGE